MLSEQGRMCPYTLWRITFEGDGFLLYPFPCDFAVPPYNSHPLTSGSAIKLVLAKGILADVARSQHLQWGLPLGPLPLSKHRRTLGRRLVQERQDTVLERGPESQ